MSIWKEFIELKEELFAKEWFRTGFDMLLGFLIGTCYMSHTYKTLITTFAEDKTVLIIDGVPYLITKVGESLFPILP